MDQPLHPCSCGWCREHPEIECELCHGRGWYIEVVPGTENDYIPDGREKYCDCPRGRRREEQGI